MIESIRKINRKNDGMRKEYEYFLFSANVLMMSELERRLASCDSYFENKCSWADRSDE
jgi:hypothetical protein